jgi:hypothetical protein
MKLLELGKKKKKKRFTDLNVLSMTGGIKDPQSRVKMVYPENARRFPAHFSLSTLMLYSPHCMQRIKRYIKGREAYLITGMPGPEDKRLAISLQVPLLAMDHEASALLMTKVALYSSLRKKMIYLTKILVGIKKTFCESRRKCTSGIV